VFDPPQLPPAGWYPDPERSWTTRYWNGREWEAGRPNGPSDALPDVGEILSGSFRTALDRWRALAILAAITAAPASVLSSLAIRHLVTGVHVVDDDVIGWNNDRLPAAIAMFVVSVVLYSFGTIATIGLMLRAHDEPRQPRTAASELESALRAVTAVPPILPRAIGWGLVMILGMSGVAVLVILAIAAVPLLGILLVLALIPAGFIVFVRWAFFGVALVDGPGNPFRRSNAAVKGRFWAVFGRLFVLGLITSMISWGVNAPVSIAGGGFGRSQRFEVNSDETVNIDLSDFAPSAWSIGLGAIAAIAIVVLSTGVGYAGMAMLYRTRNPAR
jgi:hypothetical protein